MTPTWKPSEIIIHESVREDPVTKHILSTWKGRPPVFISNSKPETIKAASQSLSEAPGEILTLITLGKQVMYISPAGNDAIDTFEIEDKRLMCPEFNRLKLASNGCYYNCDWCFLKATYRANQNYITVRVQYDKLKEQITKKLAKASGPVLFNTGELADSLSMEHLTKAAQTFIPFFGESENGYLYMLTKSTNVDDILKLKHNGHTILTWSLNANLVSNNYEIGAPDLASRLKAAKKAQQAGYRIRVRLDPVVPIMGWQHHYAGTIRRIFEEIKPERVTIGTLRFEEGFIRMKDSIIRNDLLKKMMGSMEPMLEKVELEDGKKSVGKVSFPEALRIDMYKHAIQEIRKHSGCDIALCKETDDVWKAVGLDLKECKCVCQYDSADMITTEKEVITVTKEKTAAKKATKKAVITEEIKPTAPLLPDATYEPRNLYHLEIKYLTPDPNQPRKSIDDAELKELTASIIKHGVLQPILFRTEADGKHIIVSGERRYQASLLANKDTIPAIFITDNAAEIALVENLLRVDLTAIEEAEALQRLKVEASYTNVQLSAVIGKAESTISEILKLNQLPEKIRDKYRTDKTLSKRRLLEVAKAGTPDDMQKLFKKMLKDASRDELREKREPRVRELESVFKTMIGGLTTKLNEVNFDDIDEEKRTGIQSELNNLVDLIDKKLGNH